MTALKDISMSDLAKAAVGRILDLARSKPTEKGPYVDPFILNQPFPIEITGQEYTTRPSGQPQVAISVSMIDGNGVLKKAGKLWVDLPLDYADPTTMSAEDAAVYLKSINKAGDKFLRFLRAIGPDTWNVYHTIDKTNPRQPRYYDVDGEEMGPEELEDREEAINCAVTAVSEGLRDGEVSLVGEHCVVTKRPNPHNSQFPYVNFSA